MKFIIATILTAALGFAICLYLPWWCFAITSALVALAIKQKAWLAFVAGFTGMFLLWGCMAFFLDFANNHILLEKISALLGLGGTLIIIITAVIGGLVSGMAALTGSLATKKQS